MAVRSGATDLAPWENEMSEKEKFELGEAIIAFLDERDECPICCAAVLHEVADTIHEFMTANVEIDKAHTYH